MHCGILFLSFLPTNFLFRFVNSWKLHELHLHPCLFRNFRKKLEVMMDELSQDKVRTLSGEVSESKERKCNEAELAAGMNSEK